MRAVLNAVIECRDCAYLVETQLLGKRISPDLVAGEGIEVQIIAKGPLGWVAQQNHKLHKFCQRTEGRSDWWTVGEKREREERTCTCGCWPLPLSNVLSTSLGEKSTG